MMLKHRLSISAALCVALAGPACGKESSVPAQPAPSAVSGTPGSPNAKKDVAAAEPVAGDKLAEKTGVEPGAVQRSGAPIAIVAEAKGKIEVRALGEPAFVAAAPRASLFAGDQIRTSGDAQAKIVLVDETVLELPADSAVAIGDRDAQAAPASSAAVLSGAARFTVSPRGPGEGAFVIFTPGAIVAANGAAVLGVGVAATGIGRVGVEAGEVTLAGSADLARPATVSAGFAVDIAAEGSLAAPVAFDGSGFAEWRVAAEAKAEPAALASAHLAALRDLEGQLDTGVSGLATLTDATLAAEARIEARADANDLAGYQASVPELGGQIEASYLSTLRLEQLSFAAVGRAYVVEELYVRAPEVVGPVFTTGQLDVAGALLFSKKLHVVIGQRVAPLRAAWYVHHPVGRLQAEVVGFSVPAFYAQAQLEAVPAAMVSGHLVGGLAFVPPAVSLRADANAKLTHKVYIGAPEASWKSRVNVDVAPPRAGIAWHGQARGTLLVGVVPVLPNLSVFVRGKATSLAGASIRVNGQVLVPALQFKTDVRAKVVGIAAGAHDVKIGVHGKVKGIEAKAIDVKTRAGAKLDAAAAGAAQVGSSVKGGIKVGVDVKVKAPPPPQVKVDVKAKGQIKAGGGFKIGN